CGPAEAEAIRSHLAALLAHLETAEATDTVSCSEVVPAGWNLCTVVGVLLGYPAAYTFSVEDGAENCPASLCAELKAVLDAWCDELWAAFGAQRDFVDLSVSSEVVSLPAVAL
ncbi:PREDICTED: UPF0739 protein C1orf74 homolog, partial [Tauraco erythrolophus]|uniref:UPF0739 protein C1orf74 homolog n=1 Tax=Tauraco erythrolophus TaxID=121530 RepID=UPI000523BA2F